MRQRKMLHAPSISVGAGVDERTGGDPWVALVPSCEMNSPLRRGEGGVERLGGP